jgi:hypothetical protein
VQSDTNPSRTRFFPDKGHFAGNFLQKLAVPRI